MTRELGIALRGAAPPFDGLTCDLRSLSAEQLFAAYRIAVQDLAPLVREPSLWHFADWHGHDGWITEPDPLPFDEWIAWCRSPEALCEAWDAEDAVYRAVFPIDDTFLLRFLLTEDRTQNSFALDVSARADLVMTIRQRLLANGLHPEALHETAGWFRTVGFMEYGS